MKKTGFYDKVIKKIKNIDHTRLEKFLLNLEEERKTLDFIFNSFNEGIIVVQENGEIQYTNQMARDLFSISENVRVLDDMGIDENLKELMGSALEHPEKIIDKDVIMSLPYNRILHLRSFPPGDDAGQSIRVFFLIEDITTLHIQEMKLKKAQHLASLSSISNGILHEIKNPLTAMDLHLQILERALKKAGQSGCIEKENSVTGQTVQLSAGVLRQEIDRLNNILIRFRDAIRPTTPDLAVMNICDVIDRVLSSLAPEFKQAAVGVKKSMPVPVSKINGDREQLQMVFLNLFKNALEAMRPEDRLRITVSEKEDYLQIDVSDTGSGISKEDLEKIFDPYFSTKNTGMGLGLSIVYRIVTEHHGLINAVSVPGEGTTFSLVFPIAEKVPKLLKVKT